MTALPNQCENRNKELIVQSCDGCDETIIAGATYDCEGHLAPCEPFGFIYHDGQECEAKPPLRPGERFLYKMCPRDRGAITERDL